MIDRRIIRFHHGWKQQDYDENYNDDEELHRASCWLNDMLHFLSTAYLSVYQTMMTQETLEASFIDILIDYCHAKKETLSLGYFVLSHL
jgi:hypothetical protein